MNTYPTLMELARQREAELAARARSARPAPTPATGSELPRTTGGRARLVTRLRILATRA